MRIKMAQCKNNLLVIKVLEGDRNLVLAFLVENDFKSACVVIDLKQGAHRLFLLGRHASNNNDLSNSHSQVIRTLTEEKVVLMAVSDFNKVRRL
jgi:hypothetical protein